MQTFRICTRQPLAPVGQEGVFIGMPDTFSGETCGAWRYRTVALSPPKIMATGELGYYGLVEDLGSIVPGRVLREVCIRAAREKFPGLPVAHAR